MEGRPDPRAELTLPAPLSRGGAAPRAWEAGRGISEKTAANHLEHIMDKLDLRSRARVAVWAVEHGLAKAPV